MFCTSRRLLLVLVAFVALSGTAIGPQVARVEASFGDIYAYCEEVTSAGAHVRWLPNCRAIFTNWTTGKGATLYTDSNGVVTFSNVVSWGDYFSIGVYRPVPNCSPQYRPWYYYRSSNQVHEGYYGYTWDYADIQLAQSMLQGC